MRILSSTSVALIPHAFLTLHYKWDETNSTWVRIERCLKGKRALISTRNPRVTFLSRLSRVTNPFSRSKLVFDTSPESKLTPARGINPCSFTRRITNDDVASTLEARCTIGLVWHEVGLNRGLKKQHDRSYPVKTSLCRVIDDVRDAVCVVPPTKRESERPCDSSLPDGRLLLLCEDVPSRPSMYTQRRSSAVGKVNICERFDLPCAVNQSPPSDDVNPCGIRAGAVFQWTMANQRSTLSELTIRVYPSRRLCERLTLGRSPKVVEMD